MAKKTENTEAKPRKKFNNNAHLHGYINDVRMNEMDNGRMAINLDVVTIETYKKGDEYVNNKTFHDVALFTDKKETIEKFAAIAADIKANRENRENKEYKPKTHTVSLDGIIVNQENVVKGTDEKYQSVQILTKDGSIQTDVKQADNEVRNHAELVGNIASIKMYEDKGFAVMTVMNHYRPEGSEKEFGTTLQVRVDGERKFSKPTFEKIQKGELGVGDFVRVGGQIHNNNYEKDGGKRYGMALDLTSGEVIKKKAEKVEKKAEKAEKAAPKKATSRKSKKGQGIA